MLSDRISPLEKAISAETVEMSVSEDARDNESRSAGVNIGTLVKKIPAGLSSAEHYAEFTDKLCY